MSGKVLRFNPKSRAAFSSSRARFGLAKPLPALASAASTIPTAVFVTVFAFLGTWVVARYAFRQQRKE